ncbi:MAG: hypothetical protein HY584_01200 [Candidatus Omnitrophica bacterium]|nr:hypothetical protein [Candidatus Omnitrophota bacterium]
MGDIGFHCINAPKERSSLRGARQYFVADDAACPSAGRALGLAVPYGRYGVRSVRRSNLIARRLLRPLLERCLAMTENYRPDQLKTLRIS